jgi:hypothetical protein
MGNALSIAAVSRVLRQIIDSAVTRAGLDGFVGTDVVVTAGPPIADSDRVRINLFLYRATESPALRNQPLPTHDAAGRRIAPSTLALDLQYAVTVYAEDDFQSEMMLGCAMQALSETPVLSRALILDVLGQDPGASTLLESRLAEQIENIRIRLRNLPEDAFTRLWSAFHVPYRLSAFYEVAAVIVESDGPTRAPTPVLKRPVPAAHGALGPFSPTLVRAEADTAITGQSVTLHGLSLGGQNVRIEAAHGDRSIDPFTLDVPAADATEASVRFAVPAAWPIGRYELRLSLEPQGVVGRRLSSPLTFSVAPSFAVTSLSRAAQGVSIALDVTPALRPGQSVSLALGSRSFAADSITEETSALAFTQLDIPPGPAAARLRVDGVESPWIDRNATPPAILAGAILQVP